MTVTDPTQTMPRLTGRQGRQILDAQMLSLLRDMQQNQTKFAAKLAGNIINNVLETGVYTLGGTQGLVFSRSYHVGIGSVEIENLGSHPMTISAGADSSGAVGGDGAGRRIIPAGAVRVHNLGGQHAFSVYGTAGDQFNVQVFTDRAGAGGPGGAVIGGQA